MALTLLASISPTFAGAQATPTPTPASLPLFETFDQDPFVHGGWTNTCWGTCAVTVGPGAITIQYTGYAHDGGGGVYRALQAPTPDVLVAEVVLRPVTHFRFALSFNTPSGTAAMEFDDWGSCLCYLHQGGYWSITQIGPSLQVGKTYLARGVLHSDGTFSAQVWDTANGQLVAQGTAGGARARADSVTGVSIGIWRHQLFDPLTQFVISEVNVLPPGPYGALKIENGADATADAHVELGVAFATGLDTITQMRFSDDNQTWSDWEPYATTKAWTLPAGDGTRRVYAEVRNNVGRVGHSYDDIALDTTAPVFPELPAIVVEATGPAGATVDYGTVVAQDAHSGAITAACAPPTGSTFAVGASSVSCSASDAVGNTALAAFTIDVVDTTPPTVDPMSDIVAEATSAQGAIVAFDAPAASDIVDGPLVPACTPASGSTFALGATSVDCVATDAAGNAATSSFVVTVQDTTAPTLPAHADVVAEATSTAGALVEYELPAATDLVDASVDVTCAPGAGSMFALGETTIGCTATDDAGNVATSAFVVRVLDTTAPALTMPSEIVVNATGEDGALVAFAASALDAVDGPIAPACAPASGSLFAIGNTTVACDAVDAAGNLASGAFQVRVRRTIQLDVAMENETYAQTDALVRGLRGSALVSFPGGEPVVNATVRVTIARASPELPVLNEETFEGRTNATGVFAFSPSVVLSLLGEYALVASAIDVHGATADAEGAYAVTPAGSTRK